MLKDIAIRNGLYAGVATIGYFLLFYFIRKELMLNAVVFAASTLIFLFFMVLACRQEREQRGEDGYPFALSLKTAFTTYVVAATLYYTWYHLMFAYLDPQLVEIQKQILIDRVDQFEGVLGDQRAEDVRDAYREQGIEVSFSNTLFSLAQSMLFGFILALPVGYAHRVLPTRKNTGA